MTSTPGFSDSEPTNHDMNLIFAYLSTPGDPRTPFDILLYAIDHDSLPVITLNTDAVIAVDQTFDSKIEATTHHLGGLASAAEM